MKLLAIELPLRTEQRIFTSDDIRVANGRPPVSVDVVRSRRDC
ncbi:hypothetical protein [Paraburkholderia hospita]|nr:hypothetical protein [Paraburkholderia hospita]